MTPCKTSVSDVPPRGIDLRPSKCCKYLYYSRIQGGSLKTLNASYSKAILQIKKISMNQSEDQWNVFTEYDCLRAIFKATYTNYRILNGNTRFEIAR